MSNTCCKHESKDTTTRNFKLTKQPSKAAATCTTIQPLPDDPLAETPDCDTGNTSTDTSPTLVASSLPASPRFWPADSADDDTSLEALPDSELGNTGDYSYDYDMPLDFDQQLDISSRDQLEVSMSDSIDHNPKPEPWESLPPESISQSDNHNNNPVQDSDDEFEDLVTLVPAFRQTPPMRLVYLQSAIAHITGVATVTDATNRLQDGLDLIEICGVLPVHPQPLRSLATVKKHLGLQVDDYVEKKAICTRCYKFYSPQDIQDLISLNCTVRRCQGIIYRMKHERPDDITGIERKVGLKRVIEADGSIVDVEVTPGSSRSLFSCEVGLSMTINIDWFGITENRPVKVVLKGEVTQRALASARALCPLPEYVPFNFQGTEGKSDGSPGSSGGLSVGGAWWNSRRVMWGRSKASMEVQSRNRTEVRLP
ncbi:uncharacterized protein EDB91DRAFT_1251100 [Suillus paluster]|uniref:uncharacterized protein n=1 Tax=Suillus paluster TaxID=48578 RepID=UPI001B874F3F|nr:uncharacterized protein EDB91DRAFT_1251100 [Suillus paluster]KAG1734055.1 hypothetical protein EDB91DRAFT_1251100 [Suillus paluster]